MKIHRVVSEIWPWEFSLLHLKREVCLRIPEYAGVVWSGMVFLRRKPENSWSSKQVSRVPLYASALIAYDGAVYARVDAARWSRDCTQIKEFLGLFYTRLYGICKMPQDHKGTLQAFQSFSSWVCELFKKSFSKLQLYIRRQVARNILPSFVFCSTQSASLFASSLFTPTTAKSSSLTKTVTCTRQWLVTRVRLATNWRRRQPGPDIAKATAFGLGNPPNASVCFCSCYVCSFSRFIRLLARWGRRSSVWAQAKRNLVCYANLPQYVNLQSTMGACSPSNCSFPQLQARGSLQLVLSIILIR